MLSIKVTQLEDCTTRLRNENLELRKENIILRRRNETLQQQCDSYSSGRNTCAPTENAAFQEYEEIQAMLETKLEEFSQLLNVAQGHNHAAFFSKREDFINQALRRSSNSSTAVTPSSSVFRLSEEGSSGKKHRRASRRESGFIHGSPLEEMERDAGQETRVHFEAPAEHSGNLQDSHTEKADAELNFPDYDQFQEQEQVSEMIYSTEGHDHSIETQTTTVYRPNDIMLQPDEYCIPELDETPYELEAFPPPRKDLYRLANEKSTRSEKFRVLKESQPSPATSPTKSDRALQPKPTNPIIASPSKASPQKLMKTTNTIPRKKSAPKENDVMPGLNDLRPRRSRASSVASYALPSLRAKMRRQGDMTDAVQEGASNSKKQKLETDTLPVNSSEELKT